MYTEIIANTKTDPTKRKELMDAFGKAVSRRAYDKG